MTYFYLDEPASIPYTLKVSPGPTADTASAKLHKQEPEGPVVKTEQLGRQGDGTLKLDLSGLSLEDSPIFVEFEFSSKGAELRTLRAVVLAEPRPAKVEPALTRARKGDKVKLRVAAWAALVHDKPGQVRETKESDPKRIRDSVKKTVSWQLDGKDLPDKGEEITIEVKEEHEGTLHQVEAFIGEPCGRAVAKIDCYVLEVQLHDEVYKPCGGVKYSLVLASGKKIEGTADGDGWVRESIPLEKQRVRIAYTPAGQTEEQEVVVRMTDAGPDEDDAFLAHLENLGYASEGEAPASAIVRLQAAAGLPLSGELDDETKDAIRKLVAKARSDSLEKTLFDDSAPSTRGTESAGSPAAEGAAGRSDALDLTGDA